MTKQEKALRTYISNYWKKALKKHIGKPITDEEKSYILKNMKKDAMNLLKKFVAKQGIIKKYEIIVHHCGDHYVVDIFIPSYWLFDVTGGEHVNQKNGNNS